MRPCLLVLPLMSSSKSFGRMPGLRTRTQDHLLIHGAFLPSLVMLDLSLSNDHECPKTMVRLKRVLPITYETKTQTREEARVGEPGSTVGSTWLIHYVVWEDIQKA